MSNQSLLFTLLPPLDVDQDMAVAVPRGHDRSIWNHKGPIDDEDGHDDESFSNIMNSSSSKTKTTDNCAITDRNRTHRMPSSAGISALCFLGPLYGEDEELIVISDRTYSHPSNNLDVDEYVENDEEIFLNKLQSRRRLIGMMNQQKQEKQQQIPIMTTRDNQSSKSMYLSSSSSSYSSSTISSTALFSYISWKNKFLASCQVHGNAFLWDLSLRRIACPIFDPTTDTTFSTQRKGFPGLSLQTIYNTNNMSSLLMYQTRDPLGTITFHDLQHFSSIPTTNHNNRSTPSIVQTFHSYSQSFCHATIHGPSSILVYPTQDTQMVELRDYRISASTSSSLIARIQGAPSTISSTTTTTTSYGHSSRGHGMITSLSIGSLNSNAKDSEYQTKVHVHDNNSNNNNSVFKECNTTTGSRLILACGMESGSIFYHDLAMLGGTKKSTNTGASSSLLFCQNQEEEEEKDKDLVTNRAASRITTTEDKYDCYSSSYLSSSPPFSFSSISLGNFPILSLDMVASSSRESCRNVSTDHAFSSSSNVLHQKEKNTHRSHTDQYTNRNEMDCNTNTEYYPFVTVAGLAADAESMLELPPEDRGTVGIIKGTVIVPCLKTTTGLDCSNKSRMDHRMKDRSYDGSNSSATHPTSTIVTRIRARVGTCRMDDSIPSHHIGKPGVNTCRFHPQGHIFAVGGWDHRIRIYSRTSARPLAILKEKSSSVHDASITALAWSSPFSMPLSNKISTESERQGNDTVNISLLASGNADGRICLWNAFPL